MNLAKVILGLTVVSTVGYFFFLPGSETAPIESVGEVLLHTVERGSFESIITETGDVESSQNVEIKCQVKAPAATGTAILEVVEEGVFVEEGDFLIQFDDAALRLALTEQEIVVATDEAAIITAKSDLAKAQHALEEYKSGTFLVEKATFEGELFQAEVYLKTAEDRLGFVERMVNKGYQSKLQLEAERLAVEKAQKDVSVASRKLQAHIDFTYAKFVGEYTAEVDKQKANVKAMRHTLNLSQQRRDEIRDQVEKCRCVAPAAGQVIYNNDYRREIIIEEGSEIREGQTVIRLPDPRNMHVETRINDSKINQVEVGHSARVELDVDPDVPIDAVIDTIEPFPYPRRWSGAPIEYGATLRILDPPDILKPGQRAKVHISVDQREDVLQTPVQSIVNREDAHFCLVKQDETWEVRKVEVGSNNGSFAVVEQGLEEGDQVAVNPDLIWEQVNPSEGAPGEEGKEPVGVLAQKPN